MNNENRRRHDREFDPDVHVADVQRYGSAIVIPEDMSSEAVVQVINRWAETEEQPTRISETIPVYPYDGALALIEAVKQEFGVLIQEPNFWTGMTEVRSVEVDVNQTIPVPWGSFSLPSMEEGSIATGVDEYEGRVVFRVTARIRKKYERRIRKLFALVREIALEKSILRGKAFRIRFRDEDGDPLELPSISFMDLGQPAEPIFRRSLEEDIDAYILTPIRYTEALRKDNVPIKRGVLLAGDYGTGKTLTAQQIAQIARQNGWTFIYLTDVAELPEAERFAAGYTPAVVFAEDVDRVVKLVRTDEVDEILLSLDGVDTKQAEIMTVLTTNNPGNIHPALLRPGRVDIVLKYLPPDAEAAIRLIRKYAGSLISSSENLDHVGEEMAAQNEIPARVREAVERSKLYAIRRTRGGSITITADDLMRVVDDLRTEKQMMAEARGQDDRNFGKLDGLIEMAIVNPVADLVSKRLRNGDHDDCVGCM